MTKSIQDLLAAATPAPWVDCAAEILPDGFGAYVFANAADNVKQYIYYDYVIGAKDTLLIVIGMTLNETDRVKVYASATNVAFNIFGVETARE